MSNRDRTAAGRGIPSQLLRFDARRWPALLLCALLCSSPLLSLADSPITGTASVIDGDTVEIHGTRIRLNGIDAPESRQECTRRDGTRWRCGQQAALALSDHIGLAVVRCEPHGRDRYGRTIATCFKGSEDLNRWMVATGWAVAYRKYSLAYAADEDIAHNAALNIWSGTFDMPWDRRLMRK